MEFISLAAHELRGPLTTVKGNAQLVLITARKDPNFPERSRRALHAIDQQATRMADMVAELLDATRIQRGTFTLNPQLAELNGLIKHAVNQRIPSLDQHSVELDTGRESLMGHFDVPRVEQVIRAMLDNAVRYSPDGGVIHVALAREGALARVCVSDGGIGVPDSERERIFEPFYRGAQARTRHLSGLGMGLFVARTVVERLGGRLWLDASATGETLATGEGGAPRATGSRFCLELPLASA